jgi:hypothetical protein
LNGGKDKEMIVLMIGIPNVRVVVHPGFISAALDDQLDDRFGF